MGLTIINKKTGYALGLLLCIIGGIMLLVLVCMHALGIGLRPTHNYTIIGVVSLVAGGAILVCIRNPWGAPVTEEVTVMLESLLS